MLRAVLLVGVVAVIATASGCTRRTSADNTAFKVDACSAVQRLNGLDSPKPHDHDEMKQYAKDLDQTLENVNWKLKIKNKKGERVAVPAEVRHHFDAMHRIAERFRSQVDEAGASDEGTAAAASSKLTAAASDLAASDVFRSGDRAIQTFLTETCR